VASTFYAVDRFASYRTEWGQAYNDGWIFCRQVHHIQHGASGRKIKDMEEKTAFLTGCGTLNLRFITPGARLRDISGHAPSFSRELRKKGQTNLPGSRKRYT